MISYCADACKKPSYLFDVLSLLVLFAVVLLLAECEELLLLLLLQLRQPLATFLIQLAQLLVQGRQRLLRPTVGMNAHTHTHTVRELTHPHLHPFNASGDQSI